MAFFCIFAALPQFRSAIAAERDVSISEIKSEIHQRQLWKHPQWHRLLHYRRNLFGQIKSQADGIGFFLAQDGRTNPESELYANIEALFNARIIKDKIDAACLFPARRRWLIQELKLTENTLPDTSCLELKNWRERAGGHSVTMVFSSFYLNNPSTAYGHTLLRINKSTYIRRGQTPTLLDTGINYAARPDTDNAFLYGLLGLTGGFVGEFSAVPYYVKVREYLDSESRDIWEYDLNLTKNEVDQLVDHFWELAQTHFDYYYLTENCSYHMLTALEAASSRLQLLNHMPFWVLPVDTIKALTKNFDLIRSRFYRPSKRTSFYDRLRYLDPTEIRLVKENINVKNLNQLKKTENKDRQALQLDAVIDFFDYKNANELFQNPKGEVAKWKNELLALRSNLPMIEEAEVITPPPPELGHNSMRVAFGVVQQKLRLRDDHARDHVTNFSPMDFQVRFAMHDFNDRPGGQPSASLVEMFHFRFRYDDYQNKLLWDDSDFFQIQAAPPITEFETPLSWMMRLGVQRTYDSDCFNCLLTGFEGGAGYTFAIDKKEKYQFSFLAKTSVRSDGFRGLDQTRMEIGPLLTFKARLPASLQFSLESEHKSMWAQNSTSFWQTSSELRWTPSISYATGLGFEKTELNEEAWFRIYVYK